MLNRVVLSLLLAVASLSHTATASSHGVGNPGNPFDMMMVQSCERVARILNHNFWTAPDTLTSDLQDFMTRHREALLLEIRKCELRFNDGVYPIDLPGIEPSCARTNVDPALSGVSIDAIFFSRATCAAQGIDQDTADLTVLHESIHHLVDERYSTRPDVRIDNESVCNSIALGIMNAWSNFLTDNEPKWVTLPPSAATLAGRIRHTSQKIGGEGQDDKVVIWGGCYGDESALFGCNRYLRTGSVYNVKANQWETMLAGAATTYAPDERAFHTSVWTGSKMVVWGGCNGSSSCFNSLNTGGIYDPAAKQWSPLNDADEHRPSPRTFHTANWSGNGMFVWGGLADFESPVPGVVPTPLGNGAIWQPAATPDAASTWLPLPTADQPQARSHHSTVWTGEEFIVWGGCKTVDMSGACIAPLNDGARFNPSTMTWKPISRANGAFTPAPRAGHHAYWTGSVMIVWGGDGITGSESSGALYSPALDRWFPMAEQGAAGRRDVNAAWRGDRMIVWGGEGANPLEVHEYFPPTSSQLEFGGHWSVSRLNQSPEATTLGTFIWTGKSVLHWGGVTADEEYPSVGARFLTP